MKFRIMLAALVCALALAFAVRHAHAQWTYTYAINTVSVNSATVPVSVCPAVPKASYCVKVRAAAANPIECFFYTTTLPGSAPANCQSAGAGAGCDEVSVGAPLCDAVNDYPSTNQQNGPFGQGVACVFQTSGSSVTTDCVYR